MPFQPGQSGNPAGRPTPSGQFKREIKRARASMGAALVEVAEALIDAARGARYVVVRDRHGRWVRVTDVAQLDAALAAGGPHYEIWTRDPDITAAGVVFDRIMGKVPQPLDIEVRKVIETATADQALIARVLEEHVPEEYLAPVLDELRRVRAHRDQAAGVLARGAVPD